MSSNNKTFQTWGSHELNLDRLREERYIFYYCLLEQSWCGPFISACYGIAMKQQFVQFLILLGSADLYLSRHLLVPNLFHSCTSTDKIEGICNVVFYTQNSQFGHFNHFDKIHSINLPQGTEMPAMLALFKRKH